MVVTADPDDRDCVTGEHEQDRYAAKAVEGGPTP
jgi:hypothetical protein